MSTGHRRNGCRQGKSNKNSADIDNRKQCWYNNKRKTIADAGTFSPGTGDVGIRRLLLTLYAYRRNPVRTIPYGIHRERRRDVLPGNTPEGGYLMETFNFLGSLCSILCMAWEICKCVYGYIRPVKRKVSRLLAQMTHGLRKKPQYSDIQLGQR